MTKQPISIGLIVEGSSDARTVKSIADKLLKPENYAFDGIVPGTGYSCWIHVHHEARRLGVPPRHGKFGDKPGEEDARTAVIALRCLLMHSQRPVAVILLRDSDGKPDERRKGLEQAKEDFVWPFEVVLGVAHPMRESWVLAAFEPHDKKEQQALAKLCKDLRFDPTRRSERLTKNAKKVLEELLDADVDREAQCWEEAAPQVLQQRGRGNGLSAFLDEIESRILPLTA